MSFKEDPLEQRRQSPRVLWLDRDNSVVARDNFWAAFKPTLYEHVTDGQGMDRRTWDIAWAATIAAFSFVMEGRIEP